MSYGCNSFGKVASDASFNNLVGSKSGAFHNLRATDAAILNLCVGTLTGQSIVFAGGQNFTGISIGLHGPTGPSEADHILGIVAGFTAATAGRGMPSFGIRDAIRV